METENRKVSAQEIGNRYGLALNEIENKDFGAAEGFAIWFEVHGYSDQAKQLRNLISDSETEPEQKCNHGSTTERDHEEGRDPYGYWLITEVVCDHCNEVLDSDRKYIKTSKPEKLEPEDLEPEPETQKPELESEDKATVEQSEYWFDIATNDIENGQYEPALNIAVWLEENGYPDKAKWITEKINELEYQGIKESEPEDLEPETETEPETEPEPEGKLKARINKKLFRAFIDPMYTLSDEIKLNITKTGFTVKLVDPAHVAMLETTLDKKAFEEYKANGFEVGMDLDKLQSFLKKGDQKKSAWVSMDYDGDHNKTIWSNGINERTITNIDTAGMSDPKVPNLNLPNNFTIDRKTLLEAIKEAGEVSDYVRLTSDSDGVTIDAEGDTDNAKTFLPKDIEQLSNLEAREKAITLFTLDYLEKIIRAIKSETVTIHMGTDYPLSIEWEIESADYNGKQVSKSKYLLAPRIESE